MIALSVAALLAVFLLYTSIAGGGTASLQPSQLGGHFGNLVQLGGKVVGPLQRQGRTLRFGLRDAASGRLLHLLDDALQLVVYPAGEERGSLMLEGRWSLKEIGAPVELLPDERAHLS